MTVGQTFPAEWVELTDPVSGAHIRQLTDFKAHSHHLYFTNPGWYASGTKLIFIVQILHVHPCLSPDGRQVLYAADPDGYGNVYLADIPDFDSLPPLQES